MAINQTPGEIYFIRERDLLSHKVTDYVKVGLVREKDDRDSNERLLEHQTGNPRELFIEEQIKTPAVSAIEGVLHGRYAANRVSGEWFEFTEKLLRQCIAEARDLAEEAKANISIIAEAARLKDVASTGDAIAPSPEIEEFHLLYSNASFCLSECKQREKTLKMLFIAAEEADEEVGHLIERQERKAKVTLDKEALQAKHPKIYAKYLNVVLSTSGRATFTSAADEEISMSLLGPDTDQFMADLDEALTKVENGESHVDLLQGFNLRLTELSTAAEWHQEIAMANIKAFCGAAPGITGILKWVRSAVSKEVFDEKLFKESEPELYTKFATEGETVVAHKIKKSKAAPAAD
jgi:T5orf172 domain